SYRPISLLPIASKVFEKLLLKRLLPIIEEENLIPNHQFGFRRQHTTLEQVHRIVNKIHHGLEGKRFCSAAFLDITQTFDKAFLSKISGRNNEPASNQSGSTPEECTRSGTLPNIH
ncbi:rna-directed dna polymerase from mobile element jockey-like protein, partial [Lasius niger]